MRKLMTLALAGLLSLSILTPSVAMAKEGDVIKRGACGASSTWKLKLSPQDPASIEIAFEVDENIAGHVWVVGVRHNRERVLRTRRTTNVRSGSFTVRAVVPDLPGRDIITARALNKVTGEVCFGRAILRG